MDQGLVELGRMVVATEKLRELRELVGLSRTSMADLIHVTRSIYMHWESFPQVKLRPESAARIGRFYRHATAQLTALAADGLNIDNLMPVHMVSTKLGVGQEVLLKRYREGAFHAEDLGMLGLWLYRDELEFVAGTL